MFQSTYSSQDYVELRISGWLESESIIKVILVYPYVGGTPQPQSSLQIVILMPTLTILGMQHLWTTHDNPSKTFKNYHKPVICHH